MTLITRFMESLLRVALYLECHDPVKFDYYTTATQQQASGALGYDEPNLCMRALRYINKFWIGEGILDLKPTERMEGGPSSV